MFLAISNRILLLNGLNVKEFIANHNKKSRSKVVEGWLNQKFTDVIRDPDAFCLFAPFMAARCFCTMSIASYEIRSTCGTGEVPVLWPFVWVRWPPQPYPVAFPLHCIRYSPELHHTAMLTLISNVGHRTPVHWLGRIKIYPRTEEGILKHIRTLIK